MANVQPLYAQILLPSYFKDPSFVSDYLTSFQTCMCARTTEHRKSHTLHPLDRVGVILPGWPYHNVLATALESTYRKLEDFLG